MGSSSASSQSSSHLRCLSQDLKRKSAEKDSMEVPLKKIHFCNPIQRQNFAFRNSIIQYIAKNPSTPKLYKKLVKTCKYFFTKNPFLVVSSLRYFGGKTWKTPIGKLPFDFANISCKLWITDKFDCRESQTLNLVSSIIPKIYRCDVVYLELANQIISFADFLFLSSSVDVIELNRVTVKNEDDSIVQLETLVQNLSHAYDIAFECDPKFPAVTSETFKELLKIPHFLKLPNFRLEEIPESFDLETFYEYMKNNKITTFWLYFKDSISDAFKNRVEEIVDEIIATKYFDFQPPMIGFDELDEEKSKALDSLCCPY